MPKVIKNSRPRRRDREATRAAIIAAGETAFAERGFAAATLDVIAQGANANKALVSYYFGGKEGLFDEVISSMITSVLSVVRERMVPTTKPSAALRDYIHALAYAFADRPSFPAILMREYIAGGMTEREQPFRDILQFFMLTKGLYDDGLKSGDFRIVDPHKLHLTLIAPLVHFTLTMNFRARTFDRLKGEIENPTVSAFADHLAEMIIAGLAPERAPGGMARLDP